LPAGPAGQKIPIAAAANGQLQLDADATSRFFLDSFAQSLWSLVMANTMPPEQVIRLIRGQDLTLRYLMRPPQDITGWSVTWTMRDSVGGNSIITKSVGSGITLTYPTKGILDVALAASDTAAVTPTVSLGSGLGYVWEIKRTDTGNNLVLARGSLILEQGIV
jgi:hypothetical protein